MKKNILVNICAIVSRQCETRSLIGKDSDERLPLYHIVVFLLFWVIGGIMELKLHKYWTTLLAFTTKSDNSRSEILKMIDSGRDYVVG